MTSRRRRALRPLRVGRRRLAEASGGFRSVFPREKVSAPPLCGSLPTALSMSALPSRSGQSPALASLCQFRPPPRRLPPEKAAAATDRATGPANSFPSNPALPPPANRRRGRRAPLPRHVTVTAPGGRRGWGGLVGRLSRGRLLV